ncbi:MAG: hypothetical protein WHS89_04160 [Acidimicrobiales bacterium]|jgi:hypothetical protein
MALTEAFSTGFATPGSLDWELAGVQWRVDRARRNPWFDGDPLDPQLRDALAAIVAPRPAGHGARLAARSRCQGRRNRWREDVLPAS